MITQKYYTDKNEHPEDKIYAVKKFINELSNVQDFYFNQLLLELDLNEKAHDYLFDYVFNTEDQISFEDFLIDFKLKYEDLKN